MIANWVSAPSRCQIGRASFLNVANHLLNDQGSLSGDGDFNIVVGNHKKISGLIQATGDLSISAHHITNKTLVPATTGNQRFGTMAMNGARYGEIASINARDGSVILRVMAIFFFKVDRLQQDKHWR